MAYTTIFMYDENTKEIIGSRILHTNHANFQLAKYNATPGMGAVDVGTAFSSPHGLEFSDKDNPSADNVIVKSK